VAAVTIAVASLGSCRGSDEPVRLTLLEHQAQRVALLEELVPRFERETAAAGRPIEVELLSGGGSDAEFRGQLEELYRSGRGPDLTSYPSAWVPDFAARGWLLDLTDRLAAWPDWTGHFHPVLRDLATDEDGRIHAVPRGATIIQLFYRRDVLEAAGVSTEQPADWDALVERMVELRDAIDRPPILVPAGRSWGQGSFDEGFINLMLGSGSPLYDETTDRWVVDSPGLRAVFGLYERLVRERLLPVAPLLGPEPWRPTKYQTFPDGDLPVVAQGTWGWTFDWGPAGTRPIPNLFERVATWRWPARERPTFVRVLPTWSWAIAASSRRPAEAFELLAWLSSGEPAAAHLANVGEIAPRDDLDTVAPYREQAHLLREEAELLAMGRAFHPRPGIDAVASAVGEATEGILRGELTGDEAAELFGRLVREALGPDRVTAAPSSGG
jgi:multiple sugar transport system substrate-binding protein